MATPDGSHYRSALVEVAADLKRQLRWNGLMLTIAAALLVTGARSLNDQPYASNLLYLVIILLIFMIRGADLQLLRTVTRLAVTLADREQSRSRHQ